MAVTPDSLREFATEFAEVVDFPNTIVQQTIDMAERRVNAAAFGDRHDDAVLFLAAHLLTLYKQQGSTAASARSSVKVGELSETFAVAPAEVSGSLVATSWGREYIELQAITFASRVA